MTQKPKERNSMNVYDQAHQLKAAIKESEEYKRFSDARARMEENPELAAMLKDYQSRQMAVQARQLMGEDITQEMLAQVQSLYQIMMTDPVAAEYLQCEMRFAVMIQDVYQILGEVIGLGR